MKRFLQGKLSILLLILFVIFMYLLQSKAITPLVMKLVRLEMFSSGEEEGEEPLGKIRNDTMKFALLQCEEHLRGQNLVPNQAEFLNAGYVAWALGNRTYIIRAALRTQEATGTVDRKFACKIRQVEWDETEARSWQVMAIDFGVGGE